MGTLAVQLAALAGASVVGRASEPHHGWLRDHGLTPVAYGGGVADRIRAAAPDGVDAFVDTYGGGYVDLAVELGVAPERIDTIIDMEAARRVGTKSDGNAAGGRPEVLAELAGLVADGRLDVPIAATDPLDRVRDAYRELEQRHTLGMIVLVP